MTADGPMLCGGCRAAGACRLGIGLLVLEQRAGSSAVVRCDPKHRGGPNIAHGGWTAAVFDDAMGRTLAMLDAGTVTASLTIEYLRPVPVDEELLLRVMIGLREGRRWNVSASLQLARAPTELARATGVWIERRADHYERHSEELKEYRSSIEGP